MYAAPDKLNHGADACLEAESFLFHTTWSLTMFKGPVCPLTSITSLQGSSTHMSHSVKQTQGVMALCMLMQTLSNS